MPLQTSRYLMVFSSVILFICGLTLVDQLPGISLNLRAEPPARPEPTRVAHTLQPLPPAEPQWHPDIMIDTQTMDYPEVHAQAGQPFSHQQHSIPTHTVSYQEPAEPEWTPEDTTVGMDWPVETPEQVPQESFDADDFSDFSPDTLSLPAVDEPVPQPTFPPLPADTSPAFAAPELPQLESDGGELGPASSESWDVEEPADDGAIAILSVPQEQAVKAPVFAEDGPTLPIQDTIPKPVETVGDVMVIGFVDPEEPTGDNIVEKKPVAVEGSYRIRTLVHPPKPPTRIRGTFKFQSPPVESPSVSKVQAPVRLTNRCRHQLKPGQRVCPHCGVIHN